MPQLTAEPPMGNGTEPLAFPIGALALRPDVWERYKSVILQQKQLGSLLNAVMRRAVLPRCKAMGDDLVWLRDQYPKGKKGPGGKASAFIRDAEKITGLGKAQILNYITISTGWHRLIDYMADLPEGATPIQSMRGALETIRAMNRPERPALPGADGAVDVEATEVQETPLDRACRYTAPIRKFVPHLAGLRSLAGLSERTRDLLDSLGDALDLTLREVEREVSNALTVEAGGAVETVAPSARSIGFSVPEPEPLNPLPSPPAVAPPEEAMESAPASARGILPDRFPFTAAGLEALDLAIAEAGGGAALGRELGVGRGAVSAHRKRIREALAQAS